MAFEYYKIGARTPSDIVIPVSPESHHLLSRAQEIRNMVTEVPGIARGTLRAANFVTGRKASWRDYYAAGVGQKRKPDILIRKGKYADQFLAIKAEYDKLRGRTKVGAVNIPFTTNDDAIKIIDYWDNEFKLAGLDRSEFVLDKKDLAIVKPWRDFKTRAKLNLKTGKGSDLFINNFDLWEQTQRLALALNARVTARPSSFSLLKESFKERIEEIRKGTAGDIFRILKTALIVAAVLFGGLILLQLLQLLKGD